MATTEIKTTDEQARKATALVRLLERLIEDVQAERLYGEFGVTFSCQAGQIGQYEEHRKSTFK